MNSVLTVNNISKSFKDYSSEWKRILSWFGLGFKPTEEHHILKHINFSIAPGEAVGIVGKMARARAHSSRSSAAHSSLRREASILMAVSLPYLN